MRWLLEIWDAAKQAKVKGVDIRAVTVWALLGSYDWNCLVTECRGYYEPGPFDVRSPLPRPTALATLMRELSAGRAVSHPVLHGMGWWRRSDRFFCQPVATRSAATSLPLEPQQLAVDTSQPILIIGATGTLGRAFARICTQRHLRHLVLSRAQMDMADPASVERVLAQYRPWAIVNAAGYVRVDDAERDFERCFRENAHGPSVLAVACARHDIQLLTFSSDLVFDGSRQSPYVESDPVSPLNAYGRSKAEAERKVLGTHPTSLVVRTSSFFGPWDSHNFLTQALRALSEGTPFAAANDVIVSPTYVPDLVNACLDLLVDRESGLWHLTNAQALTWAELALKASDMAGIDARSLDMRPSSQLNLVAPRPRYSALHSERGLMLPALDDALDRYLRLRKEPVAEFELDRTGSD
jgi:dTDP-4-dehydrorhamnose reductase